MATRSWVLLEYHAEINRLECGVYGVSRRLAPRMVRALQPHEASAQPQMPTENELLGLKQAISSKAQYRASDLPLHSHWRSATSEFQGSLL